MSLTDRVAKDGLIAVQQEIERSLKTVESDPSAAIHYASNTLEASLKVFIARYNLAYNEQHDTLITLWNFFVSQTRLNPKNLQNDCHKEIASGLFKIVHGTMRLRNRYSAAHGRTDSQVHTTQISPRLARLVINATNSLSTYILEFLTR